MRTLAAATWARLNVRRTSLETKDSAVRTDPMGPEKTVEALRNYIAAFSTRIFRENQWILC
jgi:hypothetical protein